MLGKEKVLEERKLWYEKERVRLLEEKRLKYQNLTYDMKTSYRKRRREQLVASLIQDPTTRVLQIFVVA